MTRALWMFLWIVIGIAGTLLALMLYGALEQLTR
jgi:hypothetical protein